MDVAVLATDDPVRRLQAVSAQRVLKKWEVDDPRQQDRLQTDREVELFVGERPHGGRFIYRICTAPSGKGQPSSVAVVSSRISPRFDDRSNVRYFLIFPKTPRPSAAATTIDAKLSSVSVISARFFLHFRSGDACGYTDIRLSKRRSVVHTVTGHGYPVSLFLKSRYDSQFVLG